MKLNKLKRTGAFNDWLKSLKDATTRGRIDRRLKRAERGGFGDCDSVGDGVSEMRLHFGPGFRIYYYQQGEHNYCLLCGGDKARQPEDIELAKDLKQKLETAHGLR
jgi:putative addiction module killer protein